ncbi:MAG TPA: hypothetical protein VK604_28360, partial [Bryobacteraceae bacterium]|nr:hypothetical protein [Bryobacteraceae bacterium]
PTDKTDTIRLIPVRAVNYIFGSNKAYIVKNQTVEAREVKLGDRFDEDVEIIFGVNEGESVATTELTRLDSGTRVQIVAAEKKAD